MAAAHGLVVGLKYVDSQKYNGWTGRDGCAGCELDVDNISSMLWGQKIRPYQLKTQLATSGNVKFCLTEYANNLQTGDLLVFYFSGHGGQVPDQSGDETDRQDETLVLYNRHLVDDELNAIWPTFKEGVRIVMISDSCNSGTNYRMARNIPLSEATPIVALSAEARSQMKATMIHMGGCRDGGVSSGWSQGGEFTIQLLKAWSRLGSRASYRDLFQAAANAVTTAQSPAFNVYGPGADAFADSPAFDGGWRSGVDSADETVAIPGAGLDDENFDDLPEDSRVRFKLEIRGADVKKLSAKLRSEAGTLLADALKSAKLDYGTGKSSSSGKFGPGTYAVATVQVMPAAD